MSAPDTYAGAAHQVLADLTIAAGRGPLGPATVLSYVARLRRLVVELGVQEEIVDNLADEARVAWHRRHEAIRTGEALAFPERRRQAAGHGGTAA